MKEIKLTEKGLLALDYLKSVDEPKTGAEIAKATELNAQGIHGVLNALVKAGFVEKGDKVAVTYINNKGEEVETEHVTYSANEAGRAYEQAE